MSEDPEEIKSTDRRNEVTFNGCIIKCHSEEEWEELLPLNCFEIEGFSLDISLYEYKMKASKIFSFILKRLRTEHECSRFVVFLSMMTLPRGTQANFPSR